MDKRSPRRPPRPERPRSTSPGRDPKPRDPKAPDRKSSPGRPAPSGVKRERPPAGAARKGPSYGHGREDHTNLRALAARLLAEILDESQSLKGVLQREQARLPKEEDRALLRETVAGVIRRLPLLDWAVDEFTERGAANTQPELLNLLRVGAYQLLFMDRIPAYAAVHETVEGAKPLNPGAGGFVNGILRSIGESKASILDAPYRYTGQEGLALRTGMPGWLAWRYSERFGDEAETILRALSEPAPTTLVFADAASMAQGLPVLAREGFAVDADDAFPLTVHVREGNPTESEAFRRGWCYAMDTASQVPARLLPLPPKGAVLDLCAAPGGKTFILASRQRESGWVLALDRGARRMRKVRDNVRRLGLENVRLVRAEAMGYLPFGPVWKAVLLDAPCSSLGTLRRNPEIRWQIGEKDVGKASLVQLAMLREASRVLAPGGCLAYSVCSIEPEETTEVAARFLESTRGMEAFPLRPQGALAPLLEPAGPGQAYLLPHRHRWDGFFVALFRKAR